MRYTRLPDPLPADSYGGFSVPADEPDPWLEVDHDPPEDSEAPRGARRWLHGAALAGLAALAVGVGVGAVAVLGPRHGRVSQPGGSEVAEAPDRAALSPALTPPSQGVQVVTAPLASDPAPEPAASRSSAVSPPRRAAEARSDGLRVAVAPPEPQGAVRAAPPPVMPRREVGRRGIASAPAFADARPDARTSLQRPAFHCDWRLRPSEQMVCADPELASLDRQLNHAFSLAVRAGASREALREQQDSWELARERAAQRSPAAVARLYRERIEDLRAIAEEGEPVDPD